MTIKNIYRQFFLVLLITVLLSLQSMICLGGDKNIVGDLSVIELNSGINKAIVKINGEVAESGRAVFTSSIIDTNENSDAVISLGKLGKIKLASNSEFLLSFNDSGISGSLISGELTVLNSAKTVSVKVLDGQTLSLNAGDSASASKNLPSAPSSGSTGSSSTGLKIVVATILGVASAAIIYAATKNDNGFQLSGNSNVVSPTR